MKTIHALRFTLLLLVSWPGSRGHGAGPAPLTSEKAIAQLKATGQYESLATAFTGARYTVKPVDTGKPGAAVFSAQNPAHGLRSTFSPDGLTFTVRTREGAEAAAHTVGWRLRTVGYGDAQTSVPAGTLRTTGQRVELERTVPAITEWFQNEPGGLEHGFTLPARPAANAPGDPLRVILAVTGDLTPRGDDAGQGLTLRDAAGRTVLTYAKLKVWDATGAELPASMQVADSQVTLSVADGTARYPLTIDPIFVQEAYLKASNTEASDFFGWSLAYSGDTVVVGAYGEDSNATGVNGDGANNSASFAGAAYVFVRTGATWTQQAYLKASNAGTGDQFGWSVAVSGDTIVVGSPGESSNATGVNGNQTDNSAGSSGAAYVFVRSGTTWSQQAYLKASNTGSGDSFGWAVAVSGDTAVIAAQLEDSNAAGVNGDGTNNSAVNSGAAYVFVRSGTAWAHQAYLKASNTGADDRFGWSAAVSGDTAVIGAQLEDSNALGINGDGTNNGATNSGAAYVFLRSGTTWFQQAYLKASNTEAADLFGQSVAISGDTAVVGASAEDSSATQVNGNQADNGASSSGAAYVFIRAGTTWTQQAYLKASNAGAPDEFGTSVAVSGNSIVVGAHAERSAATGVNGDGGDNSANQAGAAYVFTRNGTTWTQQTYLKASNTGAGDLFGQSVAVSGGTVVVGAYGEDSSATGINGDGTSNSASNAGAAYVFAGYNCVIPPSGLVLWLPLDETTGTTTLNRAAGATNGAFVNNPAHAIGYVDNSLTFDGTVRYAEVPNYPALNPGTGNFSVDAWVKRDSASGNGVRVIFDKRSTVNSIGYHLVVSFGNLLLQLVDASGTTNYRDTGTIPADNQWHFAAVTVNRTSTAGGQFYVDGVPTGTFNPTDRPGSLDNTNAFQVGRSPLGGNSPWLGGIDEVEVFNRVLSAPEVASLYGAGSSGKCKPPLVYGQPTSVTAAPGQSATFTVAALGTGAFTYQWYHNGVLIEGATSAQLVIATVTAADTGVFHAVISGPFGITTSLGAQLDVAGADLWMQDDVNDVGNEPNTQSTLLYLSNDIWVRRTADANYDPHPFPSNSPTWTPQPHEGPCYRDPKTSSPNYMYIRIRNRGTAPSSGTETLHAYWAKASTGLNWSSDWIDHLADPCLTGTPRLYGYEVTKARKNGATATAGEIADYVAAIQAIDTAAYQFPDLVTYFDKQNGVHAPLFNAGIHSSLRFLPWHREFMNRYEILLREAKPALTLLYWDWTADPTPGLNYMGTFNGAVGAPFAGFGLTRNKPAFTPGTAFPGLTPAFQSGTLLGQPTYASFRSTIEGSSHNVAHCYIGGTVPSPNTVNTPYGTMTTGNSAMDPMFFMLHTNCDRLWALWQRQNVNRWTPAMAYDASQVDVAITSDLRPWDGTDGFSPWLNQIPNNPNGYVIKKKSTHHSIVYPPVYDDARLRVPVLNPGECVIIEIPFYPPRSVECNTFNDPQHLCLLARIEPVSITEGTTLWINVANNNNIVWRNVTLDDCNIGPFFKVAPGRLGAAGELIRNFRATPAVVTLRFDEVATPLGSLFQFGHVRVRLEQNLMDAWVAGGSQGIGIMPAGPNEILVLQPGATIAGLPLAAREAGRMDVALELNPGYAHPMGAVYHLDLLQFDNQGGVNNPVGGQRYDLDFNSLKIVTNGSEWKYLDGGEVPPANWRQLNFDDQAWMMGMALFGFGRSDVETGLMGIDAETPATCYFRKVFEVPSPTFYQSLRLRLPQDDGVVVYLNGQEIARLNMPAGAITPQTPALAPMVDAASRAPRLVDVSAALALLVAGPNVLAVEVHPAAADPGLTLSDMTFDLELAGNFPPFPDQSPTVVVASPQNGSLVKAGLNFTILGDVVDADGDLTEVRIYGDGALLGTVFAPPYVAVFPAPAPGIHRVSIEGRDQFGHVTRVESVVTALSNLPPTVSITEPQGATFASGTPVVLSAEAADPDGSIASVAFYVKDHANFGSPTMLAGTDTTAPFTVPVSGLAPGMYMATAEATDNAGAVGQSLVGHFIVSKPANTPLLGIQLDRMGTDRVVTLDWALHEGVLEHTANLFAPWKPVPFATSPFPFGITEPTGFFRLRVPTGTPGVCGCHGKGGGVCQCAPPCLCR